MYLEMVYRRMSLHVPPQADVIEVGVRPEDRGVVSRRIIPHRSFRTVDRDSRRGEIVKDVLRESVSADVIISTCVLHHTPEDLVPKLLANLHAPVLLLSGPNANVLPKLFGDHQWHIEREKLVDWLNALDYNVSWRPSGLSEPLSEVLVVATRNGTKRDMEQPK